MYSETTELNYSHLDLGPLNEFGLMCLFGSMHSKALTRGIDTTVEGIKDHEGRRLYPAYFHTHLRVPESCPLSRFEAWRTVQLGVEVKRFGKCYLDSAYVIKPGRDSALTPQDLTSGVYPTMRGNNLFIIDVLEERSVARQLAVPESGSVAPLEPVGEKPAAIQKAKEVSRDRVVRKDRTYPLVSRESIAYPVVGGRDVAPGHAMIFARFCQIMDCAEDVFLREQLELTEPGGFELVEREIFYFDNAYAADTVEIAVKAGVTEEAGRFFLEAEYRLFRRSNLDLLAVAFAKKKIGEAAGNSLSASTLFMATRP